MYSFQIYIADYTAAVLLQLWTATSLRDAGWLKILAISCFFSSFLNHNLFLAIHELSHNLAFSNPTCNRWLGIFANLPVGVPMSITFQKYHLEHHHYQGVDGIDMDIPSQTEAFLGRNAFVKSMWVVLQLFFYAFRPLFLKPKPPGWWEFTKFIIQGALCNDPVKRRRLDQTHAEASNLSHYRPNNLQYNSRHTFEDFSTYTLYYNIIFDHTKPVNNIYLNTYVTSHLNLVLTRSSSRSTAPVDRYSAGAFPLSREPARGNKQPP